MLAETERKMTSSRFLSQVLPIIRLTEVTDESIDRIREKLFTVGAFLLAVRTLFSTEFMRSGWVLTWSVALLNAVYSVAWSRASSNLVKQNDYLLTGRFS